MTTDISPAVNILLDYNAPRFATKGFSEIRVWLAEGCDLEKDIVPTLRRLVKTNADIGGLGYFRNSVYKARDARLDIEQARASRPAEPAPADKEAARARCLAFAIRKLGKSFPTDERWLADYEAAHGAIVL